MNTDAAAPMNAEKCFLSHRAPRRRSWLLGSVFISVHLWLLPALALAAPYVSPSPIVSANPGQDDSLVPRYVAPSAGDFERWEINCLLDGTCGPITPVLGPGTVGLPVIVPPTCSNAATDCTLAINGAIATAQSECAIVVLPQTISNVWTLAAGTSLNLGTGAATPGCVTVYGQGGGTNEGAESPMGTIIKWAPSSSLSGLTPIVTAHDVMHSALIGVTLDATSASSANQQNTIGLKYDSDNNPASGFNNFRGLTIRGVHYGVVYGTASTTAGPTYRADSTDLENFLIQCDGTTSSVGVLINGANAAQMSKIRQGNVQQCGIYFRDVVSNGSWRVEQVNGSNAIGASSAAFQVDSGVISTPDFVENENEGNVTYSMHDSACNSSYQRATNWIGNQCSTSRFRPPRCPPGARTPRSRWAPTSFPDATTRAGTHSSRRHREPPADRARPFPQLTASRSDGAIASGSNILTGTAFYPQIKDEFITINGAGPSGGNLQTRVAAYLSSTQIALMGYAGTTVASSATYTYQTHFVTDGTVIWARTGVSGTPIQAGSVLIDGCDFVNSIGNNGGAWDGTESHALDRRRQERRRQRVGALDAGLWDVLVQGMLRTGARISGRDHQWIGHRRRAAEQSLRRIADVGLGHQHRQHLPRRRPAGRLPAHRRDRAASLRRRPRRPAARAELLGGRHSRARPADRSRRPRIRWYASPTRPPSAPRERPTPVAAPALAC